MSIAIWKINNNYASFAFIQLKENVVRYMLHIRLVNKNTVRHFVVVDEHQRRVKKKTKSFVNSFRRTMIQTDVNVSVTHIQFAIVHCILILMAISCCLCTTHAPTHAHTLLSFVLFCKIDWILWSAFGLHDKVYLAATFYFYKICIPYRAH